MQSSDDFYFRWLENSPKDRKRDIKPFDFQPSKLKTIKKPQKTQAIYLLASRRSRPLLHFVSVYHDHLRFLFTKNFNDH